MACPKPTRLKSLVRVSGKGFLPCDPPMLIPLRAQAQTRHLGQPMVALILAAHMTMSCHMVECDYQGV